MNDLLLRVNFLTRLGYFIFKVYIFKIIADKKKDKFIMPPLQYFTKLKCIGFRFDTDVIPSVDYENDSFRFEEARIDYFEKVVYHIPIMIDWLGEELEELHLGQKIRVNEETFVEKKFPKLTTLGVECYDFITMHNFEIFIEKHGEVLRCLTLRGSGFRKFECLKALEKMVSIAQAYTPSEDFWKLSKISLKEIHIHGFRFAIGTDGFEEHKNFKKFVCSISTIEPKMPSVFDFEIDYFKSIGIETTVVPFMPYHQRSNSYQFMKYKVHISKGPLNFAIENEKYRSQRFDEWGALIS
ncbi:hypothetical protein DFJ63DRAFT_118676 [Scheffersomyces coipomensis]|uniref:uncharacterized protein n=1 Tax=Scheffersomyces coipomensis TaxID=1788519 RepID=UPI00315C5904